MDVGNCMASTASGTDPSCASHRLWLILMSHDANQNVTASVVFCDVQIYFVALLTLSRPYRKRTSWDFATFRQGGCLFFRSW